MASNRSSKAKRTSATDPVDLRARQARHARDEVVAEDPAAPPVATTGDATGQPAQRQAIEEAMARQNVRAARSPGAVGPIGRMVLLIGLATLVGLIAVWVLLAL